MHLRAPRNATQDCVRTEQTVEFSSSANLDSHTDGIDQGKGERTCRPNSDHCTQHFPRLYTRRNDQHVVVVTHSFTPGITRFSRCWWTPRRAAPRTVMRANVTITHTPFRRASVCSCLSFTALNPRTQDGAVCEGDI